MVTGDAKLVLPFNSAFSSSAYWMRWQTPVCFLITVSPGIAAALMLSRLKRRRGAVGDHLPAAATWAPCFRGVSPLVLLVYRGLVVLAMISVLYSLLRRNGLVEFYFYTQWTFLLVIIYFLIGTFISAHGCWVYYRQERRQGVEEGNRFLTFNRDDNVDNRTALVTADNNSGGKLEENRAGTWGYSMQIIYQTCGGAVMLTDVVFWCLLVPYMSSAHFSVNLVRGCMHSLNLLFLLVDTLRNSLPFPWFRMAYFIIWSCTYVIFQWILHACGFSWWPYPFLELATPWAPLWYFCMALIHVPCYGAYWLIVKAKNTYFPRFFPHSYVRLQLGNHVHIIRPPWHQSITLNKGQPSFNTVPTVNLKLAIQFVNKIAIMFGVLTQIIGML